MAEAVDIEARFTAYRERRFFGSLDGIRFVSIVMVLWHHGPLWGMLEDPARIFIRGFAGVGKRWLLR